MNIKRRKLDFRTFTEVKNDIINLRDQGYDKSGTWGLARMAKHLSIFMDGAVNRFDKSLPWFLHALLKRIFLQKILRERKMKAGLKVPKEFIPSDEFHDDSKEIENLFKVIDQFESHVGDYYPNPAFGKISREEWHEIQLIHCAHHLSFLHPKN